MELGARLTLGSDRCARRWPVQEAVRLLAAVWALLGWARSGQAQEPSGWELGVHGMTVLQRPVFAGGGPLVGFRPGGKARITVAIALGQLDHEVAARGELLGNFLLSPGRRSGWGLYGIGGVAGISGPGTAGYMVLGLGLERSPGGRLGWSLEAGAGGGARIVLTVRRRWLTESGR